MSGRNERIGDLGSSIRRSLFTITAFISTNLRPTLGVVAIIAVALIVLNGAKRPSERAAA